MMAELFDEERLREEDNEALRAEGRAEGRVEGKAEERAAIADNMRKSGFTEEQIKLALGDAYVS